MLMPRNSFTVLLGFALVIDACHSKSSSQPSVFVPEPPIPHIADCGPSLDPQSLTMEFHRPSLDFFPSDVDTSLVKGNLWPVGIGKNENEIRIDTCLDNDNNFKLMQIVLREMQEDDTVLYTTIKADAISKIEGIMEALDEDISKLLIFVPGTPDKLGIKLAGSIVEGKPYTYFFTHKSATIAEAKGVKYTTGRLTTGNPWLVEDLDPRRPCAAGEEPVKMTSEIKTSEGLITYDVYACQSFEFGTRRWDWRKLMITDTGAPGAAKGKTFTMTPATMDATSNFTLETVHHNACTWDVITLPHASYGLTSLTIPGNTGSQLPGCPARETAPAVTREERSAFQYVYGDKSTRVENENISGKTVDLDAFPQ